MSVRAITLGAALLLGAVPAASQERGTLEFGVFGSVGSFNEAVTLNRGYGGGGRFGTYLDEKVAVEFEMGEMLATRTLGRSSVNVGLLSSRLVWTPMVAGPLSILLGAGAGIGTETNFLHTYGVNALFGAKYALSSTVAIRADVSADWMANYNWSPYQSLRIGLTFYRHPSPYTQVVEIPGAPGETRYRVDTLTRARVDTVIRLVAGAPRPYDPNDQLILRVQFATDSTALLPKSLPVLDTIAMAIIATPNSKWEVRGHTDSVGTIANNEILAQGRAQSVVDYLVSRGVNRGIMTATGFGKRWPIFSNDTEYGRAQNRRVQLLRTPPPPTGPPVK